MKAYDFVHLVLLAANGHVEGRTKLQKLVYFAGVLSNRLEDLGYRAHFYGPYSSKVAASVDKLRALNFVTQSVAGGGSMDSRGFEVARYDYELTEDGRTVAEEKKATYPEIWDQIEAGVRAIETSNRDYVELSIAAKTYFMQKESGSKVTSANLDRVAAQFGWKVSKQEIQEAIQWLESVGVLNADEAA